MERRALLDLKNLECRGLLLGLSCTMRQGFVHRVWGLRRERPRTNRPSKTCGVGREECVAGGVTMQEFAGKEPI